MLISYSTEYKANSMRNKKIEEKKIKTGIYMLLRLQYIENFFFNAISRNGAKLVQNIKKKTVKFYKQKVFAQNNELQNRFFFLLFLKF